MCATLCGSSFLRHLQESLQLHQCHVGAEHGVVCLFLPPWDGSMNVGTACPACFAGKPEISKDCAMEATSTW